MSLKQQLTEDMKAAMRGGDKARLAVIRLINAAIKQREVDERIELDDSQVLNVLEKMLKQRRDSISQYEAAGRQDLADVEKSEMAVIETYMPAKLTDSEIDALIDDAIAQTGATSPKDMGKVIAAVKDKAAGGADMAAVSARIKAKLALHISATAPYRA
ncbi:GatB/YqeY domain-containing protein [Dyella sp.]|uniref:GatB/YqeY domain-containing protein n=1 Tax=Dyella sp. TaxID=1869338 RepID=UPI002ED4F37E